MIEYFTLPKKENTIHPKYEDFTKLPYNARFITTSINLKDDPYYECEWTEEQCMNFINTAKMDGQVFYDGHYYGKDNFCLDKVYIHDSNIIDML